MKEMQKDKQMLWCNIDRIYVSIISFCFCFLSLSLIKVWNKPAIAYEVSIYTNTPFIYWVALGICLICGFIGVIREVYIKRYNKLLINSCFLLLSLAYASFLSLWIIRGYFLWCAGDPITHLGTAKDILASGHFEKIIFYPIAHIFLAEISVILGLDPILPHKYIPLLFGLLFVIFMYLFARSVLPHRAHVIMVTLMSMIPMHPYYLNFTPNHLSNLFIPLVFFILINNILRRKSYQWTILFIVMIILCPVFHPVPSLAIFIMLITLSPPVRKIIDNFINRKLIATKKMEKDRSILYSSFILLIWTITWISSFWVWEYTIRNVYTLMTEGSTTQLDMLISRIERAQGYGHSVFLQFLKVYGGTSIYVILTIIAGIYIWKTITSNSKLKRVFYLFSPLVLLIILIGVLHLLNLGFDATRPVTYVVIISTIFTGFLLGEMVSKTTSLKNKFHSQIVILLVVLMLTGLFFMGAIKLYPSPYILSPNWQITRTEVTGMNWFWRKKDHFSFITGLSNNQPKRYADFLLTKEERLFIYPKYGTIPEELKIPWHFGYDQETTLGKYYHNNIYMVLLDKDKTFYKDISFTKFKEKDFNQLENDISVDKFYDNEGLNVFYIKTV